jgi:glycosyltransferase involved in cell wall biosynthesis
LPCISTELSGIPELIEHGVTGILVPPADREALAGALIRLIGGTALRAQLGAAGEARVRSAFDSEIAIETLARRFGIQPAAVPEHPRPAVMIDAS